MSKILFIIVSVKSHYIASFVLADCLKNAGNEIFYLAENCKFEKDVTSKGFFFKEFKIENSYEKKSIKPFSFDFLSLKFLENYFTYKSIKRRLLRNNILDEFIDQIQPDIIIFDNYLSKFYILLFKYKIPLIKLCTCAPVNYDPEVPPINSLKIPVKSFLSKVVIIIEWRIYYIKRSLNNFFDKLRRLGLNSDILSLSLLYKLSEINGFPIKEHIDLRGALKFDIKGIPEMLLIYKEFDFPRKELKEQFFCGFWTSAQTEEVDEFISIRDKINNIKGPIVYCSLGTVNHINKEYLEVSKSFFLKLINIFEKKTNYNLVISTGFNPDRLLYKNVSSNIYIFESVPQNYILSKAELMITHGGMISILECIKIGTPMLVYPLNTEWDQNSNSSRVLFHQIGLRGNLRRDSIREIENKIELVLNDYTYKRNILNMRNKIIENYNCSNFKNYINTYLNK